MLQSQKTLIKASIQYVVYIILSMNLVGLSKKWNMMSGVWKRTKLLIEYACIRVAWSQENNILHCMRDIF